MGMAMIWWEIVGGGERNVPGNVVRKQQNECHSALKKTPYFLNKDISEFPLHGRPSNLEACAIVIYVTWTLATRTLSVPYSSTSTASFS